jgi:uncharacterized protein (TIGR02246 family)
MKFTRMAVLFMLMLALLPLAFAGAKAKSDGLSATRTAIESANNQFTAAFERGDGKALAGMYTADAIAFPPDHEMIRGNEAIGQFWQATHASGVKHAVLTTVAVDRSGDLAVEVGTAALTIQPEGQAQTTAAVKYVVVWQRQKDGTWKLHRDIWNSLPAKP